jgi:hypothetical protein
VGKYEGMFDGNPLTGTEEWQYEGEVDLSEEHRDVSFSEKSSVQDINIQLFRAKCRCFGVAEGVDIHYFFLYILW